MSRSYRNNNPGNIVYGAFAKKYGATLEDGDNPRFGKFSSAAKGVLALVALLSGLSYINLSIQDAIARYAPSNENDTKAYIKAVCDDAAISPLAEICYLNAFKFIDLVTAIIKHEGYKKD
jgi:hypothetical protein